MTVSKFDDFQTPYSKADVEKALLRVYLLRSEKGDILYPDEHIHSALMINKPYEMVVDNLKVSMRKAVLFMQTAGYELTDAQIERMVNGLLSNYKIYSLDEEARETYLGNIWKTSVNVFKKDGVIDMDNKDSGFDKDYENAQKVVDYLSSEKTVPGNFGVSTKCSKAMQVSNALNITVSMTATAIKLDMGKMNFAERLKKVVKPDLKEALLEILRKD